MTKLTFFSFPDGAPILGHEDPTRSCLSVRPETITTFWQLQSFPEIRVRTTIWLKIHRESSLPESIRFAIIRQLFTELFFPDFARPAGLLINTWVVRTLHPQVKKTIIDRKLNNKRNIKQSTNIRQFANRKSRIRLPGVLW